MRNIVVLVVSVLLGSAGETQPQQAPAVRVLYTPFSTSGWHRLDAFEQNALCKFESDPNEPAMHRVWEIVSTAPETSDRSAIFDDQLVRLQLVHRGLNQAFWVDQRGRVRVDPNKPPRQITKAALAELDNVLEDMCPRIKRAKDARRAKASKSKTK